MQVAGADELLILLGLIAITALTVLFWGIFLGLVVWHSYRLLRWVYRQLRKRAKSR